MKKSTKHYSREKRFSYLNTMSFLKTTKILTPRRRSRIKMPLSIQKLLEETFHVEYCNFYDGMYFDKEEDANTAFLALLYLFEYLSPFDVKVDMKGKLFFIHEFLVEIFDASDESHFVLEGLRPEVLTPKAGNESRCLTPIPNTVIEKFKHLYDDLSLSQILAMPEYNSICDVHNIEMSELDEIDKYFLSEKELIVIKYPTSMPIDNSFKKSFGSYKLVVVIKGKSGIDLMSMKINNEWVLFMADKGNVPHSSLIHLHVLHDILIYSRSSFSGEMIRPIYGTIKYP